MAWASRKVLFGPALLAALLLCLAPAPVAAREALAFASSAGAVPSAETAGVQVADLAVRSRSERSYHHRGHRGSSYRHYGHRSAHGWRAHRGSSYRDHGYRSAHRWHRYHDGYGRRGSVMRVSRPIERRSPSFFYRGTGIFANANPGSVIFLLSDRGYEDLGAGTSGPKIIDVATERLDRRPIGPAGIAVERVGVAKIIRIAPGYGEDRADAEPERRSVALQAPRPSVRALPRPYQPPVAAGETPAAEAPSEEDTSAAAPVSEAAPQAAEAQPAPLEPWTEEWLQHCVERHESFDASLGTFTDESGRRRFCTGESD